MNARDNNYKPPKFRENNFHCPFCDVLAYQSWQTISYHEGLTSYHISFDAHVVAKCQNCAKYSIWKDKKMVFPKTLTAPLPYQDMPNPVKEVYEEARLISNDSPRAAAALLRVALEKLTEELGEKEGNLNTRIKNLKKKGLSQQIIDSSDVIRVNANEGGAHSGAIDLTGKDGMEIVNKLFWLLNIIVDRTITETKEIESMRKNLPPEKKKGIENRDKL